MVVKFNVINEFNISGNNDKYFKGGVIITFLLAFSKINIMTNFGKNAVFLPFLDGLISKLITLVPGVQPQPLERGSAASPEVGRPRQQPTPVAPLRLCRMRQG
jgi:hypothetical protein